MLSNHSSKFKHSFDFNNPKVLHTENNRRKRERIESIYIALNFENVVNERKDANNLNLYYANLITRLK